MSDTTRNVEAASSQIPRKPTLSPGDAFLPHTPPMLAPYLQHICRLQVLLGDHSLFYEIPNIQRTGLSRSVAPIAGGTVRGPRISGKVVEASGADWAIKVEGEKVYYRLEARYALLAFDPTLPEEDQQHHYILVDAKGIYRPGPNVPGYVTDEDDKESSQEEVEWFSQLTFEAPGDSPFNWMSGMVTNGVMVTHQGSVVIDCWRMTNFPGVEVEPFPAARIAVV